MPYKLDDQKRIVTDESGNPVWITEGGEEKIVDYPGLLKRLSEVNGESNSRKQTIRELKEKFALFEGIEDLKAWKDEADSALEFKKRAPDMAKELDAQIAARLEAESAKFQAQLAPRDKALADKEKLIQEQAATLRKMAIGSNVKNSKVMERIRPDLRALLERVRDSPTID